MRPLVLASFTGRVFASPVLGVALLVLAHAAEPASPVIDPSFVSNLPDPNYSTNRYTSVWPLHDGGAILEKQRWGGVGVTYERYRVGPDGQTVPTPIPAGFFAALRDGSLLARWPLQRFDRNGVVISSFQPPDIFDPNGALSVIEQSDGKLLAVQDRLLVRLHADGRLDASFAAELADFARISRVLLDGAERIVMQGTLANSTDTRIVRLTPTGARDATFSPIATTASLLGVTHEGAVVVTKSAHDSATRTLERSFTRYRADGSRDESWSIQPWAAGAGSANKVALAPSGEIYVGYSGLGVFRLTAGATPRLDLNFFSRCEEAAQIDTLVLAPDGRIFVLGPFSRWDGFATNALVRLAPSGIAPATAPVVDASTPIVRAGARLLVQGRALGTGPLTFTWSSLDGGVLPPEIHSPLLTFDPFQREHLGRYRLDVSGPTGTSSVTVDLRPVVPPRLANVSGRAAVGAGEQVLIAGLALEVPAQSWREYKLVLRGAGPALQSFGVAEPLPNPALAFFAESGAVVDRNDDWVDSPYARTWTNLAGAFPFTTGSRDSLLVLDTRGGNYTVMLRDSSDAHGTALIEAYDVDRDDPLLTDLRPGALINLSLRGHAGAAGDPLTAGFVITDPAGFGRPMKVLVRAIGPTLAGFGVAGPLPNPRLTVFDASGRAIADNDDWSDGNNASETAGATARAGAFALPAGSKDAALVRELPAGAYTVQTASADATSGTALVEIYRVP